jgi:hypothetical protein
LGDGFAGTPNDVWGTESYWTELQPAVFFGLYGLPDFYALWRHKDRKCILWAGSDITHFKNGYWLDSIGEIRLDREALATWINDNCENYCENHAQKDALWSMGIKVKGVIPSFLGDVTKYKVSFKASEKPKLYTSVSGDNFDLYGWNRIPKLAQENPNIEFHLYGNTEKWSCKLPNVFVHGRVSQEQMDEETKKMQGALRLNRVDGFSEILAKSLLWGQWPVSVIPYQHVYPLDGLENVILMKEPNIEGRDYYLKILNRFPWNSN